MNSTIPADITAAAYIRVSDARQDEYSPDSQLKLIKQYAAKNNLIIPEQYIYYDDGISGSKAAKRPAFVNMIATAKENSPFRTILVWKFSRFARNQEESIVYKKMLKKNGINVVSISEPITDDPFGSLIERIIEWMDEYYLIRLAPEVKRGMLEKFQRGEPVAAPPLGYSYDSNNKKYIIDPAGAEIIKLIFEQFNNNNGMQRIARYLNHSGYKTIRGTQFDPRGIDYILHNPVYIGSLRWSKDGKKASERNYYSDSFIVIPNCHEPIISEETFNKAQERLLTLKKREHSAQNGNSAQYMLKGLVKCSNCGSFLTASNKGLQCWKYAHAKCDVSHYISLKKINDAVTTAIQEYAINDSLSLNITPKPKEKIDHTKQINELKTKHSRLTQAYLDGIISIEEFKTHRLQIEKQIEELQAEQTDHTPPIDISAFRNTLISVSTILSSDASDTAKNEALRTIIQDIIYNRKTDSITINFFY